MQRYRELYERAVEESNLLLSHSNPAQKIHYVHNLRKQMKELREENLKLKDQIAPPSKK